jgi:hypothetical protein
MHRGRWALATISVSASPELRLLTGRRKQLVLDMTVTRLTLLLQCLKKPS